LRYGFVLPGGTSGEQLEQAVLAEDHGWDGVFVWEAAYGLDAWSLLAAMAARTHHIRLGTLLTPLPWRRPWKVASQVVTLDQLSSGRAILTVGLGAVGDELPTTGEPTDLRERAGRLDEAIDLIRTLWRGESSYHGRYYDYECRDQDIVGAAAPVQDNIPLWVVGAWPRERSMQRVLRCDGVVPQYQVGERPGTPDDARALRAWLTDHGARPDIEVISEGETRADDRIAATAHVAPWAEAGCTWWLETRWGTPLHTEERMHQVRQRLTAGPPGP
jgi:alkanesulfonate monooxygenase SsuD/methylene tetrahydromethanopterin reductase-like flavin-dependent oxidoreductase (luciferase family)